MEATGATALPTVQDITNRTHELDTHIIGARTAPRLSEEERLEKDVNRRRQQELERRHRIFDAKRRTIGVDKEVLDAQVEEKQQKVAEEKLRDRAFDTQTLQTNSKLKMLEIEKQRKKKDLEKHCKDISLQTLHRETRREWDINDPRLKQKEPPSRIGDDDVRCGPSSLQQFSGEDLMKPDRVRQQNLAQANWIEQQRFEKAMLKQAAQDEADAHAREVADITQMRNNQEDDEQATRRRLQKDMQTHNLHNTMANAHGSMLGKEAENDRNAQELEHHYTEPFLNESGAQHHEDGRVRRDAFKGSTRNQRMQVADMQRDQAVDNMLKREEERHEQNLFAHHSEKTRRQLVQMDRDKQRARRAIQEQIAKENAVARQEQYATQVHLSTEVYTNKPTDAFFAQFGTSTR